MERVLLELLAPAKNADIGIEAIKHGADAVYIGASEFGARAAAGNDIDDIKKLVDYAHIFGVKVYVTVNTIVYDDELKDVEAMIWELYRIGVDALIVQDFGLMGLNLPPIPLHASTQMDNRTAEKVQFLYDCGYEQVVLARELNARQIADIHEACPDVKLEVFVHGAMCVSFSGQCYASEAIFGRSANRGECAQLCRMEYELRTGHGARVMGHESRVMGNESGVMGHESGVMDDGKVIGKGRLLSIKDNCQIDNLERLMDAGATSFKIEGRLKDVDYVKNVVADYSRKLDEIIAKRPTEYARVSSGRVEYKFEPDWRKSFFRGFEGLHKSVGEYIGKVKDVFTNHFTVVTDKHINNGDGVCFIDEHGEIFGFRINRAENNALFPLEMPKALKKGVKIYRNQDQKFEQLLAKPSAERRIRVYVSIDDTDRGFVLTMMDEDGHSVTHEVECEKELARTHQSENVKRQLAKMGDTHFVLEELDIKYKKNWFIPSSLLGEWRRELCGKMLDERLEVRDERLEVRGERLEVRDLPLTNYHLPFGGDNPFPLDGKDGYLLNVANDKAEEFYRNHGVEVKQRAFEISHPEGVTVMFCKHCIRRMMGMCLKKNGSKDEQLSIRLANGQEFRLEFDCEKCEMKVVL